MSENSALPEDTIELRPEQGQRLGLIFLALAGVGAGLSVLGLVLSQESRVQFFFSYLTAYIFVVQILLGSLFWVILHHLVDAGWSVVVRRVAENLARVLIFAGPLFLPVIVGLGATLEPSSENSSVAPNKVVFFDWVNEQSDPHKQHLLHGKEPYLTVWFFIVRAVIYFVVWGWLAWRFTTLSREQDRTGDVELTRKMQRLAPPAMILLALTSAFAGIDWVMTLDFTWFSTMFGVYFWAGAFLSSIAAISLIVVVLRGQGIAARSITEEHLHDLGKLAFAFVTFWAYITFSQYFLVWYADLPEEISFFSNRRWVGHGTERHLSSWHWVGVVIVFGHVILPFLFLLSRECKRNPRILGGVAAWLLVIHFVEINWQILPFFRTEGFSFNWLDLAPLAALVGGAGFASLQLFRKGPVIPVGDPRLQESIRLQNI